MNLLGFDIAKLGSLAAAIIAIFILGYVLIAIIKKVNITKSAPITKDNLDIHHDFTKDKFNDILIKLKDIEDSLEKKQATETTRNDYLVKEIMELTGLIKELLIYFKNVYNQK